MLCGRHTGRGYSLAWHGRRRECAAAAQSRRVRDRVPDGRIGRGAPAPPGPASPDALHRHSVGALTSRAAFPVTASAFAIAYLDSPPDRSVTLVWDQEQLRRL
jgi:hypothetical protein